VFLSDDTKSVEEEAKLLEKEHSIQTSVVKMDMFSQNPDDYKKVMDKLKDKDVSIIINNTLKGSCDDLSALSFDEIKLAMSSAMFPSLYVTYYLLPRLLAREKLSAVVCNSGHDNNFSDYLSRSLETEYKGKVDFMSVLDKSEKPNPDVTKKALGNLGTFSSTFSHYPDEWRSLFKLNNLFRLTK
jgi:hypothetical protein